LHAFFLNHTVPEHYRDYLEQMIPPYPHAFHSSIVEDIEKYATIIGRESQYNDFDMFLSFINSNKVAATKDRGDISKDSLLQFHKIAGYEELCNRGGGELYDIDCSSDTRVSFGLVMLLRSADIIDIVQNTFVLSKAASHFIGLSMPEKAKYLFEKYMRYDNHIIDECSRIFGSNIELTKSVYDLSEPRKEIISYLKECPVNEWINFNDFSKEIYKSNRMLFKDVGDVLFLDDWFGDQYVSASWGEFEHYAISVVLMEYLAVLGAVDILAEYISRSSNYFSAYEIAYFRVTDLGAYLFGLTDSYQEKEDDGSSGDEKGFIVQPNFDVVIANRDCP